MITRQLLREWKACWSDERIAAAFPIEGRTPRDIAADESISLDDRLRVLTRAIWYLDESAARAFAVETASLVAHLAGDEDDQALYAGLLNDLMQVDDLPDDQWEAAWAAAWDAARAAARAATRAAARAAACAAARSAARAAELRKAITRALEWLGDYADGWEES